MFPGIPGDVGLVAKSKAAQHAISAHFEEPLDVAKVIAEGKPLVVQYEVKLQNGLTCGGAYVKLLTDGPEGIQHKEFSDKTPYTIMFGPDKCGGNSKVHFIFRHKNPVTGEIEEKHLTDTPPPKLGKTTALYTLIVRPDSTFDLQINGESKRSGSLLEEFDPPVNPPAEIDDPDDKKPAAWVDEARIPDPEAKKPDDWDEDAPKEIQDPEAAKPEGWLEDEPLLVPDPEAEKPEEWDDEEDGEWTAPTIPNPKCVEAEGCGEWVPPLVPNPAYKGKWFAEYIDNPAYKGPWAPRKIPNPGFFEDKEPAKLSPIGGVGFELWTMDEDILFDNIYVGTSEEDAKAFAQETYHVKAPLEIKVEESETKAEPAPGESALDKFRAQLFAFIEVAKVSPVEALKTEPFVAAALASTVFGLLGLLAVVGSLLGGSSKPAAVPAAPAKGKAKAAETEAASTATTSAVDSKEGASKRTTAVAAKDE